MDGARERLGSSGAIPGLATPSSVRAAGAGGGREGLGAVGVPTMRVAPSRMGSPSGGAGAAKTDAGMPTIVREPMPGGAERRGASGEAAAPGFAGAAGAGNCRCMSLSETPTMVRAAAFGEPHGAWAPDGTSAAPHEGHATTPSGMGFPQCGQCMGAMVARNCGAVSRGLHSRHRFRAHRARVAGTKVEG